MDVYRVYVLAARVFTQIVHDRRTLALVFAVPLVVLSLVLYRTLLS